MYNFLYCFDSNYNVQAAVSISSLAEKLEDKANFYIIHNNPQSFKTHLKKIKKFKNINTIDVFKFKDTEYDFPNLNEVHVSQATYFRMFIENYIPKSIEHLIYIDPDIVCLDNPTEMFDDIIVKMIERKIPLAGLTEGTLDTSATYFKNLGMKNDKYFNAGMIVIDFHHWVNQHTLKKLLQIMKKNYHRIIYWDQDIMNLHFDGNYLEIPRSMNYIPADGVTMSEEKTYFHHYAGSKKPWYFENVFNDISEYYQQAYKNLFNNKFHVTIKFKKHEVDPLLSNLKSPDINSVDKLKLIYGIIKTNFYLNEK